MSMRRFEFVTGDKNMPGGDGVVWDDTMAAFRETLEDGSAAPVTQGAIADIEYAWGGREGYEFTWIDNESPEPTLTNVAPIEGSTAGGDTVVITGTGFKEGN